MNSSTINIQRTNEFANRARVIKLFLDDVLIGNISNGETQNFDVTEGEHILIAKIDWCSSRPFKLNCIKGEEIKIELGSSFQAKPSFKNVFFSLLPLVFLYGGIALSRHYENDTMYYAVLSITTLMIVISILWELKFAKSKSVVYYITFGRNDYLYLKKLEY